MKKRRLKKAIRKAWFHANQNRAKLLYGYRKDLLRPTHRELAITRPIIEESEKRYQEIFQQACMEVLGEDPNEEV